MGTEHGGIFLPPDDGNVLVNPIGGRMALKLRDEDTAGAYSIHDNILPARSPGPRPHIHHKHEESFYVIEGELTVRVGPRTITAPAGSFVVIPRGVVHQPSNRTSQPTRVLLIFSPGGMDSFFADAAAERMPLQAPSTDLAILESYETFAAKYDFAFAEFPVE
jgi:mannose-6-phosphate isomerase-like protein (cupin superfamily)